MGHLTLYCAVICALIATDPLPVSAQRISDLRNLDDYLRMERQLNAQEEEPMEDVGSMENLEKPEERLSELKSGNGGGAEVDRGNRISFRKGLSGLSLLGKGDTGSGGGVDTPAKSCVGSRQGMRNRTLDNLPGGDLASILPQTTRDRNSMDTPEVRDDSSFDLFNSKPCDNDLELKSKEVSLDSIKEKRKWGDKIMSVWGKRQLYDKRKWGDNSMTVWGKRQADDSRQQGDNWGKGEEATEDRMLDKRKWGDKIMSVWGKRQLYDKRKWGDNSMTVWGKRRVKDKRKWGDNSMTVWGKRQADDKRKWGDNSITAWGKREDDSAEQGDRVTWGDNSIAVWGRKRGDHDGPIQNKVKKDIQQWLEKLSPVKVRTEDPNTESSHGRGHDLLTSHDRGHDLLTSSAWVKTNGGNDTDVLIVPKSTKHEGTETPGDGASDNRKSVSKRSIMGTPEAWAALPRRFRKRGWGFWGAYVSPYRGPKRNWETNTMKVWGKRQHEIDREAEEYSDVTSGQKDGIWKRLWTSDNFFRIWGK